MTRFEPARVEPRDPVAFLPGVRAADPLANYWLRQVTVRLRREMCWLWRERGTLAGVSPGSALLPPFIDRGSAALDLVRYDREKRGFFAHDVTAKHLSELVAAPPPDEHAMPFPPRGSFAWLVQALGLAPVECFVLAAALLPVVDSAAGSVIASCLNDPARTEPDALARAAALDGAGRGRRRLRPRASARAVRCAAVAGARLGRAARRSRPRGSRAAVSRWRAAFVVAPADAGLALRGVAAGRRSAGGEKRRFTTRRSSDRPRGQRRSPALPRHVRSELAACGLVQPVPSLRRDDLPQVLTAAWLRGRRCICPRPRSASRRT